MIRISQNDPKFKGLKIGKSNTSYSSNGCYIACLLNARRKFYPNEDFTPEKACREWNYVRQGTDPEPHYLAYSTDFPGFEVVSRVRASGLNGERKWNDEDLNTVKTKMHMDNYAVCLEVLTKYGSRHWLMADKSFGIGGIKCVDPWPYPANVPMATVGPFGRYVRYTGFSVIKKKP